ncbi:MAG: type II secretion system F family protein [Betaproteobacteria bacterium]|nr:type II secretion system F family protein [Betaproteobacteria bacterium]
MVWTVFQLVGNVLARQRATIQEQAGTSLKDMFIFVDPAKMFRLNAIALFVVPTLVWFVTRNLLFAAAAAVVIILLPRFAVGFLQKKRLRQLELQLPDALLMVAGSMRAGAALTVALESMVSESRPPISQEFELLLREQRVGVDFDTALRNMEKRIPLQDFTMVISGMRISREVGGNLADILESLADTLRRKHTMEGKIDSLTAQGRMQGIVMTCLPIFLIFVLRFMEPEAMAPLFDTLLGWGVLAVVGVMEAIGYVFIRKIVNIDV